MTVLNETNEELIAIVTELKDAEDNDILGKLIGKGVPFNKAKGVLDKIMVAQGFRMTKAQLDEKAEEILAAFSIDAETTPEEVNDQIDDLVDELNCTVNKARNYVKSLFTEAEIAYPKMPKKASGPRAPREPGYRGDVKISADYALENPEAGEDDQAAFKAYMDENGGSTTSSGKDKSANWYSSVIDLRIFGKQWQDKHC